MTIDIKVIEDDTSINVSSDNKETIDTSVSDNSQLTAELKDETKVDTELNVNALDLHADIGEVQITSESITDYESLSNRPKINGSVLSGNKSSNDLGLADVNHIHDDRYFTEDEVNTLLTGKVDTEEGKGLSTNDYSNADKEKLASLSNYELPIASDTTLGGIKVGEGLAITNGVLSTTGGGEADSVQWNNVLNKPSTFTPSSHTHTKSEISDFPTLSTVATSGSYNDLTNKPTIPTVDSSLSATSTNPVQNKVIKSSLDGKANSSHTHTKEQITDFPTLASVATSGSYNDLSDKPDIPSPITVDSALSSTSTNPVQNKIINSALNNKASSSHNHDSRYYTESEIDEKIPTKTSQLTNDSGYLTSLPSWTQTWSGKCNMNSTITCTIPTTAKAVIMRWYLNGYYSTLYLPKTMITTTATKYIVSDDTEYGGGQISISGTTLTYKSTGQNNNYCYLDRVYYLS